MTASRWAAALAFLAASLAFAQPAGPDPLDARLRNLESELRCLVCQNQTLADSDAPLAVDLAQAHGQPEQKTILIRRVAGRVRTAAHDRDCEGDVLARRHRYA